MIKYFALEKDRDIARRNKYIDTKCNFLGSCNEKHSVGASGSMNY
jgi:hypothetical protein